MTRQRKVEVFVAYHNGTWEIDAAHVPASLSEEKAKDRAIKIVESWQVENVVAFTGIYCCWDDDMMEGDWEEEEEETKAEAELSQEDYIAQKGRICPACRTEDGNTEGGSIDIEGTLGFQEVICLECEARWNDVYKLVGYSDLR